MQWRIRCSFRYHARYAAAGERRDLSTRACSQAPHPMIFDLKKEKRQETKEKTIDAGESRPRTPLNYVGVWHPKPELETPN